VDNTLAEDSLFIELSTGQFSCEHPDTISRIANNEKSDEITLRLMLFFMFKPYVLLKVVNNIFKIIL
jgi:hypothetical protein